LLLVSSLSLAGGAVSVDSLLSSETKEGVRLHLKDVRLKGALDGECSFNFSALYPPVPACARASAGTQEKCTDRNTGVLLDEHRTASTKCTSAEFPTSVDGCDFNWRSNTSYWPDGDFLKCVAASDGWQADSEVLQRKLFALQNPVDCDHPNPNAATTRAEREGFHLLKLGEFGVGAALKHFEKLLSAHWTSEIPVITGNSWWRYSDSKCGEGWSCFFSPLTKCSVDTVAPRAVLVLQSDKQDQILEYPNLATACRPNGEYSLSDGMCHCSEGYRPQAVAMCNKRGRRLGEAAGGSDTEGKKKPGYSEQQSSPGEAVRERGALRGERGALGGRSDRNLPCATTASVLTDQLSPVLLRTPGPRL
jgi:hypothetical protein